MAIRTRGIQNRSQTRNKNTSPQELITNQNKNNNTKQNKNGSNSREKDFDRPTTLNQRCNIRTPIMVQTNDIWINLPAKDLEKIRVFFQAIGFQYNAKRSNEGMVSFITPGKKNVVICFFTYEQMEMFTGGAVKRGFESSEVLLSLGADSKEQVDTLAQAVIQNGGQVFAGPTDIGNDMYTCGFADPEGHRWNVLYMGGEPDAAENTASESSETAAKQVTETSKADGDGSSDMTMCAYLEFENNAKEAMEFYAKSLNGKVVEYISFADMPDEDTSHMPKEQHNLTAHIVIEFGKQKLMASDNPSAGTPKYAGFNVQTGWTDMNCAKDAYDKLGQGGEVVMPFGKTSWSKGFGIVRDQYGVSWMFYCE